MDRLIFLTGRSGVGKTSVLLKAVEILRAKGYKIGGMVSQEFRKGGVRMGFEIVDLATGMKGWLAHINQMVGPRVGKYRVNLNDLNNIGVSSIIKAVEEADIIIVDEIGPMELFSTDFKNAVIGVINSKKPMIGTIHYRTQDLLINKIKVDAKIIEVTNENRDFLHTVLINKIFQFMQRRA